MYASSLVLSRFATNDFAWLTQASITNSVNNQIGNPITFPVPTYTGNVTRLSLQLYKRQANTDTILNNPITWIPGQSSPSYIPVLGDIGYTIVGVWSAVLANGASSIDNLRSPESNVIVNSTSNVTWPGDIDNTHVTWSAKPDPSWVIRGGVEVRQGRLTFTSSFPAIPAGFRLGALRSNSETPNITFVKIVNDAAPGGLGATITPGVETYWDSDNGTTDGTNNYMHLFWVHVASGEMRAAAPAKFFVSRRPVTIDVENVGDYANLPPYDIVVSDFDAAISAANARIASETAGNYIIDIETGNFGGVSIDNMNAGSNQRIIFRSRYKNISNTHIGGCTITQLTVSNSSNLSFEYLNVNRHNLGFVGSIVHLYRTAGVYFQYNNVSARDMPAGGWSTLYNTAIPIATGGGGMILLATRGIFVQGGVPARNGNVIRANRIHGPINKAIVLEGTFGTLAEHNVGEDIAGDFIFVSWGAGATIVENWGSRIVHPSRDPGKYNNFDGGWDHVDFIQTDQASSDGNITGPYVYRGNVTMLTRLGDMYLHPYQGVFASATTRSDFVHENNIIGNMSPNAVTSPSGAGHLVRYNSCLRIIDYHWPTFASAIVLAGSAPNGTTGRNIICQNSGSTGPGTGWGPHYNVRLYNNVSNNTQDFSQILTIHHAWHRESTLYDSRPIAGTPAHWGYSDSEPWGAYEQWRKILVDKRGFPIIGPALAAWKRQYDPNNQIIGAI